MAIEKHSSDPETRLADVLISAVFYGGLANPRAVTSLANVLVSELKPLQIAGDNGAFAWIDLILIGDKDPLNDKVSNESAQNGNHSIGFIQTTERSDSSFSFST